MLHAFRVANHGLLVLAGVGEQGAKYRASAPRIESAGPIAPLGRFGHVPRNLGRRASVHPTEHATQTLAGQRIPTLASIFEQRDSRLSVHYPNGRPHGPCKAMACGYKLAT